MKPMIAARNHPSHLFTFNVIKTNSTFSPQDKLFPGNLRQLL
jgi:hypothetical protein